MPTAAVVVEVVSPDDETYEKSGFYAAHGVDELIVADPAGRSLSEDCWMLRWTSAYTAPVVLVGHGHERTGRSWLRRGRFGTGLPCVTEERFVIGARTWRTISRDSGLEHNLDGAGGAGACRGEGLGGGVEREAMGDEDVGDGRPCREQRGGHVDVS